MEHEVIGIGNALMDILTQVDEKKILALGLQKGIFNLVDEDKSSEVLKALDVDELKLVPGGSVANTMAGIANMGGKAMFYGRVGKDEHGDNYHNLMKKAGVASQIVKGAGRTGTAITLITPDSQRTFATHLGVATSLEHSSLDEAHIKSAKIL
ncbi:adenosine kinase, partial [Candidatus Woesearchaeota archaeon CG08_land_8_20_14_0_20_43_7]